MKKQILFTLVLIITILNAYTQEGMWMLTQLDQLDLAKKGLKIPVEQIYSPEKPCIANAILQLGGGTASFVSSDGLIVTNHHVAFAAIQRASTVNSDYLTNGYLAVKRDSEIQAPGYHAKLMIDMEDVTSDVLEATKGINDLVEKEKKVNAYVAKVKEDIETKETDNEAEIVPMFEGRIYIKYVYKVFKDIRIVYCPPLSVGNYGGETDNWMWPRHTGDFSFLRIYVDPQGKGAEYNPMNVPYKPKIWLKVSEAGPAEGDFNFIIGYPGFTTRYRSSNSVTVNFFTTYPFFIDNFKEIISISEDLTKNDPAGKLKVASFIKGIANVMKNYQGKVDGFKSTHFLQKKFEFEKEFLAWANTTPERKEKYSDILLKEKAQYDIIEKTRDRNNNFYMLQYYSGTLLSVAVQLYYLSKQLEKPVGDRQPGISERSVKEFAEELPYIYGDYFEPMDKALLLRILKRAAALPASKRIDGLDYIYKEAGNNPEQWVDNVYKKTKLGDSAFTSNLIGKSSVALENTGDPIIKIAASIYKMSEEINASDDKFAANVDALRKEYLKALYEWKGLTMYPDANSTIRFTWGPVKGYIPADAIMYLPFTTLKGMVDKNTDTEPFNAPSGLISLEQNKDFGGWLDPKLNDVPVDFLDQCDITGGNSGSPVMNAKGEIIGLAFDGNYEAMISDWQYDYALQRTIIVDFRYVLFITEKFSKANYLLDEMHVKK